MRLGIHVGGVVRRPPFLLPTPSTHHINLVLVGFFTLVCIMVMVMMMMGLVYLVDKINPEKKKYIYTYITVSTSWCYASIIMGFFLNSTRCYIVTKRYAGSPNLSTCRAFLPKGKKSARGVTDRRAGGPRVRPTNHYSTNSTSLLGKRRFVLRGGGRHDVGEDPRTLGDHRTRDEMGIYPNIYSYTSISCDGSLSTRPLGQLLTRPNHAALRTREYLIRLCWQPLFFGSVSLSLPTRSTTRGTSSFVPEHAVTSRFLRSLSLSLA